MTPGPAYQESAADVLLLFKQLQEQSLERGKRS
jgi:hypothetical protein